jgi:hypothetical protein
MMDGRSRQDIIIYETGNGVYIRKGNGYVPGSGSVRM